MAGGRTWTKEEDLYLEEKVGRSKISTMANKLGRTAESVEARLAKLGIDNTKLMSGCLTAKQLTGLLKVDAHVVYRWIKKHGLKARSKITRTSAKFYFIRSEDFWSWAKENKEKINFSKIEPLSILPEPGWVTEEREKDAQQIPKKRHQKWTDEEDERLQQLIKHGRTYQEISDILGRSKVAVEHRAHKIYKTCDSKVKPKKIQLRWSEQELNMFLTLDKQGLSDKEIAYELGREREHIVDIRRRLRGKGLYVGNKVSRSIG